MSGSPTFDKFHNFNAVTRGAIREIFNNPREGFKYGIHFELFV